MKVSIVRTDFDFDIHFIDAANEIKSAKNFGAFVEPLLIKEDTFVISSRISNETIEIYSFWKDKKDKYQYSLHQIKANAAPKQSLLVGDCTFVKFAWIEKLIQQLAKEENQG